MFIPLKVQRLRCWAVLCICFLIGPGSTLSLSAQVEASYKSSRSLEAPVEILSEVQLPLTHPYLLVYFDSLVGNALNLDPQDGLHKFQWMTETWDKQGNDLLYLQASMYEGFFLLKTGREKEGNSLIRGSVKRYLELPEVESVINPLFFFIYRMYAQAKQRELMLEILLEMHEYDPETFGDRIYDLHYHTGYLYYYFQEYQEAIPYLSLLAERQQDDPDRDIFIVANAYLGWTYRYLGNFERAIYYFQRYEECSRLAGSKRDELSARKFRANIYELQGQFNLALHNYLEVLEGEKNLEESRRVDIAWTLNAIGSVYSKQGNVDAAEDYFRKALKLYSKEMVIHGMATNHRDLGNLYLELGKYDSARFHLKRNLELRRNDSRSGYTEALVALAKCYYLTGDEYLALNRLVESIQISREMGNLRDLNSASILIAEIQLSNPSLDRSILQEVGYENLGELIRKVKEMHTVDPHSENQLQALEVLNRYYEHIDNIDEAYKYLQAYTTYRDSLFNRKQLMLVKDMEAKAQLDQKDKEIRLLENEQQLQNLEIQRQKDLKQKAQIKWAVGALLIIVLLYVFFLRYRNKQKHKDAKAKLEREKERDLNEMRARFFANITHEFKTPLTLIDAPVNNLLSSVKDPMERRLVNIIRRNSMRLKRLTNEILELNKVQDGRLPLRSSEVSLNQLIRTVYNDFRPIAIDKRIDLKMTLPEEDLMARIDREKMEEVLFNLVSNALKFTDPGKSVEIQLATSEEGITIEVSDQGKGMPGPEILSIFDRYYTSNERPEQNFNGTGLGLAICQEYVQLHGGEIKARSKLGEGSVFLINLPLPYRWNSEIELLEKVEGKLPENAITNEYSFSKDVQILLVEDNIDMQYFIKNSVLNEFNVAVASNGEEGISMSKKLIPDLIISDIMMPDIDGNEFLNAMKEESATDHIPFIFLTARTSKDERLHGMRLGADAYLEKPFIPEELIYTVKNMLKRQDLMREKYRTALSGITKQSTHPFLENIRRIILEEMDNQEFSVVNLAKKVNLSRSQLHRKLTVLSGVGPSQFIRKVKLEEAKRMMENEDVSIAEISYQSGFSSPSYFSKCFKEEFGYAPSEIQGSLKNKC